MIQYRSPQLIICDFESDRSLSWGDDIFIKTLDTNRCWKISGAMYVECSGILVTGTGSANGTNTGDNATNTQYSWLATSKLDTNGDGSFLTGLTKSQVGLSSADNTSDANKPVSAATQTALNLKASLASPSFIGTVVLPASTVLVTPVLGAATGTSLSVTGAITSSGGGIGYVAGAGGSVTQLISRTTTVVLNKLCGNITMFSAVQAANALVTFTLINSFIAANDFVLVQHISATNGGAWVFSVVAATGSCTISIANSTAASITSATPLKFMVIKGAIT